MIIKGSKINDRYSIIRTLGEGGMANVYLAYDTILDRNVAVKVLRGDLQADEKFVRRFQREALSASNLYHPNIVQIYDFDQWEDNYYIVMEYVEGRTLKQLLKRRGALTVTEVIDIMSQVTDGMAHAHDAYIIHRDIKPQNIMILDNGLIKITDFGIAMALNNTQLTQTNSVMGSVHYLPPEQAAGKGSTIKSDIYSMGVLMYELLAGEVPFKGDNAVEIALKHLKEPLPSIRKILPELPQSLENIIIKATAKNPANRYKDAREMHQDLITAMDESRINEKRYVYPYPENDNETTKVLDEAVKEVKMQETKESDDFMKEEDTGQSKLLIILASIFTGLIVLLLVLVYLLPKLSGSKTLEIPDLSGKSKSEAISTLTKMGFNLTCSDGKDTNEEASDTVEIGYVVRTDPEAGTTVKEGRSVCIKVSSGEASFELSDYIGRNYLEAKGELQAECKEVGCIVNVDKKKIKEEDKDKYKDDEVLETLPESGEVIKRGSKIILYIPDVEVLYPDFSTFTEEELDEYATKYGLVLQKEYQENSILEPGTITYQNRKKGDPVVAGVTLKVTITKAPQAVEDVVLPVEENGESESTNE